VKRYAPRATAAEINKLRAMAERGMSLVAASIALEWDNYQRVQYWSKRLGLSFSRHTRQGDTSE
jgi:hypothetical protein